MRAFCGADLAPGAGLEGGELHSAAGGTRDGEVLPPVLRPGLRGVIDYNVGPEAVHGQLLWKPCVQISQ